MAETVIVLYLSHFWSKFDEILYAEIFLPTWKAYQFSSRSHRLQGQRSQGHKGQRPKNFEINFLSILLICETIAPTFEAQYPQYHWTYGNCQLCNPEMSSLIFQPSTIIVTMWPYKRYRGSPVIWTWAVSKQKCKLAYFVVLYQVKHIVCDLFPFY